MRLCYFVQILTRHYIDFLKSFTTAIWGNGNFTDCVGLNCPTLVLSFVSNKPGGCCYNGHPVFFPHGDTNCMTAFNIIDVEVIMWQLKRNRSAPFETICCRKCGKINQLKVLLSNTLKYKFTLFFGVNSREKNPTNLMIYIWVKKKLFTANCYYRYFWC